jgi:membrane-bound metal-dependent hydrolase YbcI (DUF457 family)
MSWAAHDLEPYVFKQHWVRLAIVPLILGSWLPDMFTKPYVYGFHLFGVELKADDPEQFHRGWPGVGFTHSLAFGVVVGLLVWVVFRSTVWGVSLAVGQWAHALTDIGDEVGCMLFFPFSTENVALGAWAYAAEAGRYVDAAAYYSGPGGVLMEGAWLVLMVVAWRVVKPSFFYEHVLPTDSSFRLAHRLLPPPVVLALYHLVLFWGITRWVGWMLWAHVVEDYPFDLSWGGPHWVDEYTDP